MILPIRIFGDPVLKKPGKTVSEDHPGLQKLIDDMFETMYNAQGIGLAAPQIGQSLRLFVVDATPTAEDEEEPEDGLKEVFINPEILEEGEQDEPFEEGCLSIPLVREKVIRPEQVKVKYLDRDFKEHTMELNGIMARVFQHEFDHVEGVLFTDHLSPLKKRLLKGKLDKITKGKMDISYPVKPLGKRR